MLRDKQNHQFNQTETKPRAKLDEHRDMEQGPNEDVNLDVGRVQ